MLHQIFNLQSLSNISLTKLFKTMYQYAPFPTFHPLTMPYVPYYYPPPCFSNYYQLPQNLQANWKVTVKQEEPAYTAPSLSQSPPPCIHPIDIKIEEPQKSVTKRGRKKKLRLEMYTQIVEKRNIFPNNLNMILSYIRRSNKSGKMVEKIIRKLGNPPDFNLKNFYSYQIYLKENMNGRNSKGVLWELSTHLDPSESIFSIEEQNFYNRVCRILVSSFLHEEYLLNLLNNRKIHKTSKCDHLKVQRYILMKLKDRMQADPSFSPQ